MKMTEITIKTELGYTLTVKGWLFTCCGLRLVAHRQHNYAPAWAVSEYSTGMKIPIRFVLNWHSDCFTRKRAIDCAMKFLTNHKTSLQICRAVMKGIETQGILN